MGGRPTRIKLHGGAAFLALLIAAAPGRGAAEKKPAPAEELAAIAVLDFSAAGTGVDANVPPTMSEFIRIDLVNSGQFKVLDRQNMASILKEQSFQQTGCTTVECAVQIGSILNVRKMVVGNVSVLNGKYFINAYVVDVETSEIDNAYNIKANTEDDLRDAAKELAINIVTGRKKALVVGKKVKLAFYWSLLPGGGQFYNGHPKKGLLVLAAEAGALALAMTSRSAANDTRDKYLAVDQYDYNFTTLREDYRGQRTLYYAGLSLFLATYISGAFEAQLDVRRSQTGKNQATVSWTREF